MADDDSNSLDLDSVDLDEGVDDELKELSQEDEAMKVLVRLAEECGLGNDKNLIREIYTDAVQAHDDGQENADVTTTGRKIYEQVIAERPQEEGGAL